MIKDIISFSLQNGNYAIELQRVPIILTASKYLSKDFNPSFSQSFKFGNYDVEIIDLANLLNTEFSKVNEFTKILVGEQNEIMFGLVVDRVMEIVNLNGEHDRCFKEPNEGNSKLLQGYLDISDEQFKLLDVDQILHTRQTNFKT